MGECADEHRAQEQQCIKDAYTEPEANDSFEELSAKELIEKLRDGFWAIDDSFQYEINDDDALILVESQLEFRKKKQEIDAFLESLNHIIYCGHQDLPMYKTSEMLAKTQIAEAIRDNFMRIFEITKEKIENYQPPDDMEVDAEDDCCDSDGYD